MKTFFIFLLLVYQMVDGSQRPMDTVADLTNDLGVCILQILATMQDGNIVFSPYGIASVSVLLFEGAAGNTAYEILRVLNLPWDTLLARIGFRDLNRHLKTYFKSDGFLRGLIMSRDEVCFHSHYQKILRLYGFEEPDNSLTYPCHGFIPYSPSTTALPAVTTEAVTIASTSDATTPADNTTPSGPEEGTPASTEITTVTDENIVTELTQTSQTVMLFNTTTFRTVNASDELESNSKSPLKETTTDIMNTDNTVLRTDITSFPQESFTATSEAMLTSYNVNPFVNVANLSSTQPSVTALTTNEKLNEPLQTTEITETSPKSESVTLPLRVNTIEPSGSETILVPNFSSPSSLPFDISSSESSPESIKTKFNRVNATRSLFKQRGEPAISKTNRELLKNEMKKILEKYKHRNFTNINDIIDEIENDFRSNSTEKNSSFPDDFIDDLLASTKFAANSSEESIATTISNKFNELNNFLNNFTTINSISSTEFFKDFINKTQSKFYNDSSKNIHDFRFNDTFDFSTEKFDHDISLELIPLNETSPLFNSSTEVNFNEITTIYDTLFGLIENTTQGLRNFIGFSTTTVSPITTTIEPKVTVATPNSLNTTQKAMKTNGNNFTTVAPNVAKTQPAEIPALSLKNNLNRSELVNEASGGHILPKKSISGENEDLVSEYSSRSPSNYVNVVSLKQSKLTSTKFNIKGIHPSKQNFKRSKREELSRNSREENVENQRSGTIKANAKDAECNSSHDKNVNNSSCITSNLIEKTSSNQTALGNRKVRSFDHDIGRDFHTADFLHSDSDWFALYDDRNMIRVPTFFYSAYLPFAYIDDLKSKVVEIPLDDSQYSLILLLPTHRYGLNYLLSSLTKWPIRKIHRQLRSHSVYTIIPKFKIVSHVNLKPALYALGMKDVFYRYRADLSVMSPDARLFVRSIEQVVTVNVDKYPNAVYEVPEKLTERYFAASHPFLYFVIDKESGVSLVAGIMADPSKQQIHFL